MFCFSFSLNLKTNQIKTKTLPTVGIIGAIYNLYIGKKYVIILQKLIENIGNAVTESNDKVLASWIKIATSTLKA